MCSERDRTYRDLAAQPAPSHHNSPVERGGYATQTEAETTRQKIEQLLAIPELGPSGDQARNEIVKGDRADTRPRFAFARL